jgi:hypothetical protein
MTMRKPYSKPEISFECFKMSSNIAAACSGLKANSGDMNSCEYIENGLAIFVDGNNDCDVYDCYHVMTETSGLFGS